MIAMHLLFTAEMSLTSSIIKLSYYQIPAKLHVMTGVRLFISRSTGNKTTVRA